MTEARDLEGRTLLAVFAHPDDESIACGGLLAWCAERGARVALLCVTKGDFVAGPDVPARTPPEGGRVRELEAAANALGLTDVIVLGHRDGYLPWADAARVEADIRAAIEWLHPDVVVTFGADGLYWHPDHIAVHDRTTAVVTALGPEAPALYYVTMAPGRMRALVDAVAPRARDGRPHDDVLGITVVDAFGALAQPPSLVVDTGRHAVRKLAALRCHASQVSGGALELLTDDEAATYLGVEHFHRADAGPQTPTFLDTFADPGPPDPT
jgi:LmbE family N-acetylglucosaminyl deacetylase